MMACSILAGHGKARAALATLVLALLDSGHAAALESYICIADKSTGFQWNGTEWAATTFTTETGRYVVKEMPPALQSEKAKAYTVTRVGERTPILDCSRFYLGTGELSSRIVCGSLMYSLLVDLRLLRFQEFYGFGYLDGDDERNTPGITIGTCSRLE